MHLALSTPLLQQPKQVCLPRPSFAQSLLTVEKEEKDDDSLKEEKALESYAIFPRCSINLITCSSNSGKTRFLQEVIRHRQKFFDALFSSIAINGIFQFNILGQLMIKKHLKLSP